MKGTKLPNQDRIRTFGEKENYKYLGILETNTIKQAEMKEKNDKRVLQTNTETPRNQRNKHSPNIHQRNKHLASPSRKILGTILKTDKGGTQTNEPVVS